MPFYVTFRELLIGHHYQNKFVHYPLFSVGKTLAFLLPALIHTDGQPVPREERGGPSVLVIAPTRELALQIDREVKKYHYKGITA